MGYIKDNLPAGETIIEDLKMSKSILVIAWILGGLFCWLILPIVLAIMTTLDYACTEYVITDKKIHEKTGFIQTVTNESPLYRIENITCTYSLWGRLFNYGTVIIYTANGVNIYFRRIANAEKIKSEISALINSSLQ